MDNKSILIKANSAITNGNNEEFLKFCTDDVVWNFVGDRILTGKESIRQYMNETYIVPPKFVVEILIAEDDFVTALGKISLTGKDGKAVNYSYCDVWCFKNGKMAELKAFVIELK